MGVATAFPHTGTDELRADAERLAHIIMEMQRCFILRLSKELAREMSRSRSSSS